VSASSWVSQTHFRASRSTMDATRVDDVVPDEADAGVDDHT
jgi:hypothetical protein